MKKLILPLFTFIIWFSQVSLFSQDGWLNQMKEINANLYDIYSPQGIYNWDGFLYWMVGDSGTVLKSAGGPFSWSRQESGTEANLRGVYFFLDGTGYCVGDGGVCINSVNFGNQWVSQPVNTTTDLNDIWFTDDTTGLIIGDSGLFLVSEDRGNSWDIGSLNSNQNLNKIRQLSGSSTWIVGDSASVFKSIDGGNNWQVVNTGFSNDFNDVYLADDQCAYIVGDDGLVIRTEDSGLTWNDFSIPDTADLNGVACSDCYNLWVCGDHGTIFYKTDADTSWNAIQGNTGGLNYHSLMYIPESGYFFFPADSGSYIDEPNFNPYAWVKKAGENINYHVADFVDEQTGFIGGMHCTLLHTTNGGLNWYSLNFGDFPCNNFYPEMNGLEFTDHLNGWVVLERYQNGDHSWILGTNDGGLTWTEKYFSTTQRLYCIFFLDQYHGWVGGTNGLVIKTENGGDDWAIVQEENTDLDMVVKLHFINQQDGYMLRGYGEFLSTHDGGNTWLLMADFEEFTSDFHVINDTIIWVMMGYSGVNKSEDGGLSWTTQPFPYNNLAAWTIFFQNENEGWAGGSGQSLWHTIDGGYNWNFIDSTDSYDNYIKIIFTDSTNGWLIGQLGAIMHGPGLYVGVPEIQDVESDNLFIFPNPAQSMVNFKIPDQNPDLPYSLAIYNVIGQQMISKEIQEDNDTFTLDISSYQPGIYIVVCRQESEVISSGKFIIISKK